MPTFQGEILTEVVFGELLHFRKVETLRIPQFAGNGAYDKQIDSGQTSREYIAGLAAVHGWPLYGVFLSGAGSQPDFVLVRQDFPVQGGAPGQRVERLQNAVNAALEGTYKLEPTQEFTADPATDVLTTVEDNDLEENLEMQVVGSDIAEPLEEGINYYSINVEKAGPRTFQLSLSESGAPIDITTAGSEMKIEYEQGSDQRFFFAVTRFFNHRTDGLYMPPTDYRFHWSKEPPGNWWE